MQRLRRIGIAFVRNSSLLDLFLATVLVNLHFCSTEFDFQFFWLYSRWFGTIGILARFDTPHFGIEFVYAELLLGLIYPRTLDLASLWFLLPNKLTPKSISCEPSQLSNFIIRNSLAL